MSIAALLAGGSLVEAVGSIQSGIAQSEANEFDAKMLDFQSKRTKVSTKQRTDLFRRDVGRQMEDIRSQVAASGVLMSGTPLEVMAESRLNAELDALNMQYEGDLEAGTLARESRMARSSAKDARRAGRLGGISSLLSGTGRLAGAL
jgi:hypothetical protein